VACAVRVIRLGIWTPAMVIGEKQRSNMPGYGDENKHHGLLESCRADSMRNGLPAGSIPRLSIPSLWPVGRTVHRRASPLWAELRDRDPVVSTPLLLSLSIMPVAVEGTPRHPRLGVSGMRGKALKRLAPRIPFCLRTTEPGA
jgi:hypothetical protein